jgi:hypothetical protein
MTNPPLDPAILAMAQGFIAWAIVGLLGLLIAENWKAWMK